MKIICVGRNFGRHALELGNEIPKEPVLFMKPDSALMRPTDKFYIPDFSTNIHHEAEIVIRIDRIGKRIQRKFARKYFSQFSLGLDFTARDLQDELKAAKLPWEKAKAFDQSAYVGTWLQVDDYDLNNLNFKLMRNDQDVQIGNTSDMLFNIETLIEEISKYFTLKIGDLVFTGTPAGVGPVSHGDTLNGFVEGKQVFSVDIR